MSALEWLRRQTRRDREKRPPFATGGVVRDPGPVLVGGCIMSLPTNAAAESGAEPAPKLVMRHDLDPREIADFEARWNEFVNERIRRAAIPARPRPAANGWNCGCMPRYTRCYCNTNTENA